MRIGKLIRILGEDVVDVSGDVDFAPAGIAGDHRKVNAGGLFVCVKGFASDGHDYAADALMNGAGALISQKTLPELNFPPDIAAGIKAFMLVRDSRRALAAASQLYYGEPTKRLRLVGVTGTKGKTTTVYMIRSILRAAGIKAGMLGTVENDVGGELIHADRTTPGAVEFAAYLSQMLERGCSHAVMEVSSQGLALSRVDYCMFEAGVFTNFYRDHISPREHADMDEYLAAKLKLFSMCKNAVINADIHEYETVKDAFMKGCQAASHLRGDGGPEGRVMYPLREDSGTEGRVMYPLREGGGSEGRGMLSFSSDEANANHPAADIRASRIELLRGAKAGTRFFVETPRFSGTLTVGLPGRYNISNALAAISVCEQLGISFDAISEGLRNVEVRGRTQYIDEGQDFSVLVDFAHNAASLEALLQMLREYGYKRVTTVFGCGGGRASERRYDMGEVSGRYSNLTVITSDNPRQEAPGCIMEDIEAGMRRTEGRYIMIEDRREAIDYAIKNAERGEMVLIAGKGHETTQTFADRVIPFDDAQVARDCLRAINK